MIALDKDGNITQQGTAESIAATEGYDHLFAYEAFSTSVRRISEVADDDFEEFEEFGLSPEGLKANETRRTGDLRVYRYYIHVAGKWRVLLYLLLCAGCVFGLTFPCKSLVHGDSQHMLTPAALWLQWWTNANAVHPNANLGYWLGIYGGVSLFAVLACLASDWSVQRWGWICDERLTEVQDAPHGIGAKNVNEISRNLTYDDYAVSSAYISSHEGTDKFSC